MTANAIEIRVVRLAIVCFAMLGWAAISARPARAAAPDSVPIPPPVLSLDAAVAWALQNNPELAAVREQHGIAAAGVVIAETYPFNPVTENKVWAANGPESAGITNRLPLENKVLIDLEVRGQGRYRRQGANAVLSRTDWEIAVREADVAVRVMRAFDTVVYRQEKLRVAEEMLGENRKAVDLVRKLVDAGRLRPADLVLARTEVDDVMAQLSPIRSALVTAQHDLRRALGVIGGDINLVGNLETPPLPGTSEELTDMAQQRRPDIHVREAAVAEAMARLNLEVANRYGNPNLGPAYQYDPTRINYIGIQFTLPLPVCNKHCGEIQQRQAEVARAQADQRQAMVQTAQEVRAALARLESARAWAETYRDKILPNLNASLKDIERLFEQPNSGADVFRVIDIRRKVLRARDAYLDALWEVRQARADLAAALGDPFLVAPLLRPSSPTPAPVPAPAKP